MVPKKVGGLMPCPLVQVPLEAMALGAFFGNSQRQREENPAMAMSRG